MVLESSESSSYRYSVQSPEIWTTLIFSEWNNVYTYTTSTYPVPKVPIL